MPRPSFTAALALLCLSGAAVAQHAHQHGVASLGLTLDGAVLTLTLDTPLDSLLGFERGPRTAAEKTAAAAVLRQLDPGTGLFKPNPEAGCVLTTSEVTSAVLQSPNPPAGEHADLTASYQFRCERAASLGSVRHGLFAAFPRLRRIDAQFALPGGQGQRVLKRGDAVLTLKR